MEASLMASSRSFATFWAITRVVTDSATQSNAAVETFRNILVYLLLAVEILTLLTQLSWLLLVNVVLVITRLTTGVARRRRRIEDRSLSGIYVDHFKSRNYPRAVHR